MHHECRVFDFFPVKTAVYAIFYENIESILAFSIQCFIRVDSAINRVWIFDVLYKHAKKFTDSKVVNNVRKRSRGITALNIFLPLLSVGTILFLSSSWDLQIVVDCSNYKKACNSIIMILSYIIISHNTHLCFLFVHFITRSCPTSRWKII